VAARFKPGDKVIITTPGRGRTRRGVVDGFLRDEPNVLRIVLTSRRGKKYRVYYHVDFVKKVPV